LSDSNTINRAVNDGEVAGTIYQHKLWLQQVLERAGLITLDPTADKWRATQKDIVANPKNLELTLLDFAAQSRSLPDLDAAVGYTEYYLAAKVPVDQKIFGPPAPFPRSRTSCCHCDSPGDYRTALRKNTRRKPSSTRRPVSSKPRRG
jgi:ABC-type metal ion transport system substrate-binding protein